MTIHPVFINIHQTSDFILTYLSSQWYYEAFYHYFTNGKIKAQRTFPVFNSIQLFWNSKSFYLFNILSFNNYAVYTQLLSHLQLFETPWTVECLASLSMGFPRQECWSELPFPSPGDLPDLGTDTGLLH